MASPEMELDKPGSPAHSAGLCRDSGPTTSPGTLPNVNYVNIITLDILETARYQGISSQTAIMGFVYGTKLGNVKILAKDLHVFKRLSESSPITFPLTDAEDPAPLLTVNYLHRH